MSTWKVVEIYEVEVPETWLDLETLTERAQERKTLSIKAERQP